MLCYFIRRKFFKKLGILVILIALFYFSFFLPVDKKQSLDWFNFLLFPQANPKQDCKESVKRFENLLNHLHHSHSHHSTTTNKTKSTKLQIVEIIHQSWKSTEIPKRVSHWSNSWKLCFPQWKYYLWTDDDNRCLIQEYYSWFLPTYDSYPYNIHRVDAVRYFYMHLFGGLYTDLDNECLRPFEHLLQSKSVVFGAMEGRDLNLVHFANGEGYVQNSFMYSKPGHLLWNFTFDRLLRRRLVRTEFLTGPELLMRAINAYRKSLPDVVHADNDVAIYPGKYFNPISWAIEPFPKGCRSLNRMTIEEERECRQNFVNSSYVIQYHTQSWYRGLVL